MKLRKFSTGSLIKNVNKNINNISSKKSNNILFNKQKSQNVLNLPHKKNSYIQLNKRAITSSNLNFKENKIKYKYNKNAYSNSQKSLISKSNSDLRAKTDIGLNINSPNSSMNIFLNKKKNKLELNKISINKYKKSSISKNFSSRNFDGKANSFELLKLSNEDILSNKKNKNKKFNDSLKTNNRPKLSQLSQFSKNKSNFNSCNKINYKLYNKKKNNQIKKYNNIFNLLSKKNKLKNQIINFSALLDKYLYDSTYINLYQSEKENININSNNNKNNYKYNKLMITNNNNFSHKNKRNINRRGKHIDFQTKLTQPKNPTKKKINLPKHPNSKIINTEINQMNQYFSRKNINLTESNIQFDKRLGSRIKKDDTSKILIPINLKKKNSHQNINHKNNNIFTEDFFNDYFEDEFSKNKNAYEGVEIGHFNIVKMIQENKKRILEQNQ